MSFTREAMFENARFGFQVARYHTWPVHRQQSVGEHTAQMLAVWWRVWGPLSAEESTYVLWHDAGELVTGDPPFPFKSRHPEVKHAFDREEAIAVEVMGGPQAGRGAWGENASAVTLLRCKIVDLLEMWEFGMTELRMGNEFARCIVKDTFDAVAQLGGRLPREDFDKVLAYTTRMRDWYQVS